MTNLFRTFAFLLLGNICLAQNYAVEFDGVDDKITLCHDDNFNIGTGFTIEAWIYAYNWKTEAWRGSIVNKDMQGPDSGFAFRAGNNGTLSFVMSANNAWNEIATSPTMNKNQWYHVAVVIDENNMSLLINGEVEATGTYAGTPTSNIIPLTLGFSPGFPDRAWDGIIDDVRIWSVARSTNEIVQNMSATFSGTEPGLVAYLPLDDGATLVAENLVGCNGNFGGMTETAWVDGFVIPASDVGVTELVSPDVLSIYERPTKIRVNIKNFGNEPVANFPVILKVNDVEVKNETYFGALQPDQTAPFTFEDPYDFTVNPNNKVEVTTNFVDDGNLLNDAITVNYLRPDAGPVLNIFDEVQHDFGNNGQTQFAALVLPYHTEDYEKILLHFQVDCPSTGCDPWDQPAAFYLDTPDGSFEIARYITPYGQGCGPWTVDVTDFKSVMRGPVTFRSFIQVWGTSGWLVTADLEFIRGDSPSYQNIHPLWESNNWVYGDPTINHDLQETTVDVASVTESGHLRMTITGHGQGNTDNAAEFSNRTHTIMVNGANAATHNLWKNDCEFNDCANQAGTWEFDRAGWCPGQHVTPLIHNLDSDLTPNGSISMDYELENYTNLLNTGYNGSSHTEPHYRIHAYLIEQSTTHFESLKNLRAEEVLIGTNNDPTNPIFENVSLVIQNTGTEDAPSSLVAYYVNDVFIFQENINEIIPAGGNYTHEFSTVDGFTAGVNNKVTAVVTTFGDENFSDDAVKALLLPDLSVNAEELELATFNIFPNPSNGQFQIELSDQFSNGILKIMDAQGRIFQEKRIEENSFFINIKKKGLYFISAQTENGNTLLEKIIVH